MDVLRVVEGRRRQNPINGDGSNVNLDDIEQRIVGLAEDRNTMVTFLNALTREHKEQWARDYLDFIERERLRREKEIREG